MNIKDLVLIEVTAEGYYSGNSETCVVVVEKSFVEEYEDDFLSVWFSGLDGKHSEIEGVVSISDLSESNIKGIVSTYLNAEGDDYKIWDSLFDGIDESIINKQFYIDVEFCSRASSVTTYYLDGEEL